MQSSHNDSILVDSSACGLVSAPSIPSSGPPQCQELFLKSSSIDSNLCSINENTSTCSNYNTHNPSIPHSQHGRVASSSGIHLAAVMSDMA